ncbi:hypothetical protein D3C72_2445350 [compost metagenome]
MWLNHTLARYGYPASADASISELRPPVAGYQGASAGYAGWPAAFLRLNSLDFSYG